MGLFKRRKKESDEQAAEQVREEAVVAELPPPPATDADGRRSVDDQVEYLLGLVDPLPAFGMYLLDAWGTAVCEDITADTNLPEDDLVAVDGYAVRSADLLSASVDTPVSLQVRDDRVLSGAGMAVKMSVGQTLPEGADAVVPTTRVNLEGQTLTVADQVKPGDQVRWAGSEVRPGVPIMRSGQRLDARLSALLALAGIDRVLARPRPRVVVLSTDADRGLNDVNSHMIAALVKSDGAQVWRVPFAGGSDKELRDMISDQLIRADLVITTGVLDDTSQLLTVIRQMGRVDVGDVALRPGGRVGFGLVGEDDIPMLMVQDDPLSAYTSYVMFARPLINRLMGVPVATPKLEKCLVGGEFESAAGVVDLRFATIREQSGELIAVPLGRGANPKLGDMVSADAVIVLEADTTKVSLGDRVGCWMLND